MFNMFSIDLLYLVPFFVFVLAGDPEPKCIPLRDHFKFLGCCNDKITLSVSSADQPKVDACRDIPLAPNKCDYEKCIANNFGFIDSDGKRDKKFLLEAAQKDTTTDPEHKQALIDHCVNGDISVYGPPASCDSKNLINCIVLEGIDQCKDWDNEGACSGMKELFKQCKEQYF